MVIHIDKRVVGDNFVRFRAILRTHRVIGRGRAKERNTGAEF
jgi:hypothetical protein